MYDDEEREPEEDAMQAAKDRLRLIRDLDAELAELVDEQAIAERQRELERRRVWESLPPVRLRPGVATHRLTEQESELLDREGY